MGRARRSQSAWLPWSVYGALGALGAAVSFLSRGTVWSAPASPRLASDPRLALALGVALAVLLSLATISSTRILVARTAWARELHDTLRSALLGSSTRRLLALALLSSLAEELFFRAALLPYLGLFASSLIFGSLHVSSRDKFVPWMLWAALMGALFGLLFLASGSLWPPILAHAVINHVNMRYLCRHDCSPVAARSGTLHSERWRRL